MTKPEKQDGTMELDVGQIDLLDLQLPPQREESGENLEGPRVSKGPPPLPPSSLPPIETASQTPSVSGETSGDASASATAQDAANRAFAAEAAFNPLPPKSPPRAAVSARKLVAQSSGERSPAIRFLLGVGGATLLCVALVVGYRVLAKKPVQAPPQSAPTVSATASAPTQAFTMAPIEFTADESASAATSASASAAPTTSSSSGHAHAAQSATTTNSFSGAPHATGTPKRTDEVIKVEN